MNSKYYTPIVIVSGLAFSACDAAKASYTSGSEALEKRVAQLEKRVEGLEKAPSPRRARPKRPDPNQRYNIPVDQKDAYRGGHHAKVTIVEAYEYACPYCALVEPMMDEALEHYSDTDLKVVSKQFVVHPQRATDAALAVCAAHKQDRFAEFNTRLWAEAWPRTGGRPRLAQGALERPALVKIAREVGMNPKAFETALDSAECKQKLQTDKQALARIGVHGTPYIFLNGKLYNGPRSIDGLKAAIDREIQAADKAIAGGVLLKDYYAHLMKSARKTL